jgi:hypothetical protein
VCGRGTIVGGTTIGSVSRIPKEGLRYSSYPYLLYLREKNSGPSSMLGASAVEGILRVSIARRGALGG